MPRSKSISRGGNFRSAPVRSQALCSPAKVSSGPSDAAMAAAKARSRSKPASSRSRGMEHKRPALRKTCAHDFRLANVSAMARPRTQRAAQMSLDRKTRWARKCRLEMEALFVHQHCAKPEIPTPSPMAATKVYSILILRARMAACTACHVLALRTAPSPEVPKSSPHRRLRCSVSLYELSVRPHHRYRNLRPIAGCDFRCRPTKFRCPVKRVPKCEPP